MVNKTYDSMRGKCTVSVSYTRQQIDPKLDLNLFGFPVFWLRVHLVAVVLEKRCVHSIRYLHFINLPKNILKHFTDLTTGYINIQRFVKLTKFQRLGEERLNFIRIQKYPNPQILKMNFILKLLIKWKII